MVNLNQGDIIWLDFNPQSGFEQSGRRPAVIISNQTFNQYSSMFMVCPITHTNKKHAFHIELDRQTKTDGYILCDQARILDVNARNYKFIEKLPSEILEKVKDLVISFIE